MIYAIAIMAIIIMILIAYIKFLLEEIEDLEIENDKLADENINLIKTYYE